MKILFNGLGSIGQKHLRNLLRIVEEPLEIHALRSSHSPLDADLASAITKIYHTYQEIEEQYDIIFITNPTSLHYEALCNLQNKAKAFFIEKPAFHAMVDLTTIANQAICYVACPLRHSAIFQYVKEYLPYQEAFHIRSLCSSYLPNWRPAQNYKESYSAKQALGGGVDLDLIHEWDYLSGLVELPASIYRLAGKHSALDIETNDAAVYVAHDSKRIIEVHLDYFGHIPRRTLELFTPANTYIIDFMKHTIQDKDSVLAIPKQDMYERELRYFLQLCAKEAENINDLNHAMQVLSTTMIPQI